MSVSILFKVAYPCTILHQVWYSKHRMNTRDMTEHDKAILRNILSFAVNIRCYEVIPLAHATYIKWLKTAY